MEYTTMWQPMLLIFVCIVTGLGIGALLMHRKLNIEISHLEDTIEIAHTRLKELLGHYNVVRSKKDKIVPTKLDDSFKAQLQLKDDKIDRVNSLLESKTASLAHDSNQLTIAAAQILVLEGRISKNKKIAIARETELTSALTTINNQLEEIDELQSDSNREGSQLRSSTDEIGILIKMSDSKDNNIERLNKRIIELENELEDNTPPEEGETGYYKKMKKF